MEIMFQPAKSYEKIVDLGSTKNAVGNEIFRESLQLSNNLNLSNFCKVGGNIIAEDLGDSNFANLIEGALFGKTLGEFKNEVGYGGENKDFCEQILGGVYETRFITGSANRQAPLIVRITKFLLRLTIILSITMILYNGILRVLESAKGEDVKNAKDNIIYIVGGILLALSSVALINLVSSITLSSLNLTNTLEYNTTDKNNNSTSNNSNNTQNGGRTRSPEDGRTTPSDRGGDNNTDTQQSDLAM